jgi:hypothetical protein
MRKHFYSLVFVVAVVFAAGCDSIFGPDWESVPGVMLLEQGVFEVPSEATVHEEIQVRIETAQPDGCSRKGATRVAEFEGGVEIRPFDERRSYGSTVCIAEVQHYMHEGVLVFESPGTYVIRVIGGDGEGNEVVVERELVVSP